jgi:excisionase family DNA binding protein
MEFEQRVTKRELARLWGVSERTIERWMRDGGLPFEKPFVNGSVRFVPSQVGAWARERTARLPPLS